MKIHEKIRYLRESKQLSQADVAKKIGISAQGYAKIEQGETQAIHRLLDKIAEALDVHLIELMGLGEKNVICLITDNNITQNDNNNNVLPQSVVNSSTELVFEIQKLQAEVHRLSSINDLQKTIIECKDKEIMHLEQLLTR